MELEISASNKIKSKEEVTFTIYAKDLIDIVRKLPEKTQIKFKIEESKIYLNANKNTFELNTFSHLDFPALPKTQNTSVIKIKQDSLKELIENTSFSMGNQDIRAYLNGLFFELNKDSLTVVATDGHRLSIGEVKQNNDLEERKTVILPRKAVLELTKLLNKSTQDTAEIHLSDNYFSLIDTNTKIISRLIDGNFPNYKQVMPTDFSNTIIIDRMDFLSSLQQASIFVDERTKGVKLVFRDDKLSIFSHSERGRAETQLEVTKQEKELEIAFNIHYLISILEKLTTTKINMVIPGGENKSCLLSATDDESYQYIVMPMRI
jgi:DNA polymerase-3 subunit beta